jgi:hypothetical protein
MRATEPRIDRLEEKLGDRADDEEFQGLVDNFGLEASREALGERRRLLAHASAGAFDVTMTIAQAARAERVLRHLDPVDIERLRRVELFKRYDEHSPDGARREDLDVLVGQGCVSTTWGAGSVASYSITSTGHLVLRLLRSYQLRS